MDNKQQLTAQKHPLQAVLGNRAKFVTNDGRVFVGVLKGLDQALNCIISEAEERVYSQQNGVAIHRLGTYFIRGESIIALGEFAQTDKFTQNHFLWIFDFETHFVEPNLPSRFKQTLIDYLWRELKILSIAWQFVSLYFYIKQI